MANSNVANTQVVPTATKDYPYYDDYNEDKNFHRILFRPGYAVQARELTQVQTMVQNQIERFGRHIFVDGSKVLGGVAGYRNTDIITLSPTFGGSDINLSTFEGKTIYQANNSEIRATVLAVDNSDVTAPKLAISYLSGDEFQINAVARITDTTTNATVSAANTQVRGAIAHISEGIFFVSGYFVKAPSQSIILSTNSTTPTYKVGLELQDEIVTESEDVSLLDPALESSNFQAPGATRYKINLVLAKREIDNDDDLNKFIEVLRVEEGVAKTINKFPIYSELGETLARRTYDESGNYTVDPFLIELKANTANANVVTVVLDPGKAYIKGFEFETDAPSKFTIDRARTTRAVTNYDLNMPLGNFITVNKVRASGNSFFDVDDYNKADIHCVKHGSIATSNNTVYNSTKIGTTLVTNMIFDNTPNNQDTDSYVFKAFLAETNFIALNSDSVGTNANTQIAYQTINIVGQGAATRNDWYNLSAAGNGEFRLLFNTYSARNNVNVFFGTATSQTALLFSTMGTSGLINVATIPTESEILEHEALGGSRFIGSDGKPPNLGVDDITRFGIIRLNKFGGFIQPDGTVTTNTHIRVEVTGATSHEYSLSVRANNANSTIALSSSANALRYSSVDDAYTDTLIRVYDGPAEGYVGTIVSYNGATRVATVSPPIPKLLPNTQSKISITFDETDMESFVIGGLSKESRADLTVASKLGGVESGDAFISETGFRSLLYVIPDSPVALSTITNQQYAYKRVYGSVNFNSSGEAQISQFSAGTTETLVGSGVLSASQILDNYLVIVKDSRGSANIANGQIISFAQQDYSVNVSSGIAYFKANLVSAQIPSGFSADIYATSQIDSGLKSQQKTKILLTPNNTYSTTSAPDGGPFGESNTSVYLSSGQIYIRNPNRTIGNTDSLFISDVFQVNAIYQAANTEIGSIGPNTDLNTLRDVTTHYILDNGQRRNLYDHASIKLRPGFGTPTGSLLVCVDYYQHSSATSDGFGYFSADSYSNIEYEDIPILYDPKTEETILIGDCIDFRPVRTNATNNQSSFSLTGTRLPIPNENFNLNYQYYLPRIDRVTLNRSLQFKIYTGVPSESPAEPDVTVDDMTLYTLYIPAYTFDPKDIDVQYHENRRYTMRDIGTIENRVRNLEYYSTLSLLESSAMEKTIRDSDGLERTKYGVLVDSFSTFNIADTDNPDFSAAIDTVNNELTPRQIVTDVPMIYDRTDYDVVRKDDLLFLRYTPETFIQQEFASKPVPVTEYLIARFDGQVKLSPESDVWFEEVRAPDVIITLPVRDAITVIRDPDTNIWTGRPSVPPSNPIGGGGFSRPNNPGPKPGGGGGKPGGGGGAGGATQPDKPNKKPKPGKDDVFDQLLGMLLPRPIDRSVPGTIFGIATKKPRK